MRSIVTLLLFCVTLVAQTVQIANYSDSGYDGVIRLTVDKKPPFESGGNGFVKYHVGRKVGKDTWIVDVQTHIASHQNRLIDLGKLPELGVAPLKLPKMDYFGGPAKINGQAMDVDWIKQDGRCFRIKLRKRVGHFMVLAWIKWWPDMPYAAEAEVVVDATDHTYEGFNYLTDGFNFSFGNGVPYLVGKGVTNEIVEKTVFRDGQARTIPVKFLWLDHIRSPKDFPSIGAWFSDGVVGYGLSRLYPDGNPIYPTVHDSYQDWTMNVLDKSTRALHSWEAPPIGGAAISTVTGAQWDQTFRGNEMISFTGAVKAYYFGALNLSKRPCHILQQNGDNMKLYHTSYDPRLLYWHGRTHWHTGVSPNRLGKKGEFYEGKFDWLGPDVDHWLISSLTMATRATGSEALQWQLEQHAVLYTLQYTTERGFATSAPHSARARGWECLASVLLYDNLENRELAEEVKKHNLARLEKVILKEDPRIMHPMPWEPRIQTRDSMPFDQTTFDWWFPWQQSIGAYGIWLSGRYFDHKPSVEYGVRAARACVEMNWQKLDNEKRYRGTGNLPVGQWIPRDPAWYDARPRWFEQTWDVPAVFVAHQSGDAKATEIWNQVLQESRGGGSWFPPWDH